MDKAEAIRLLGGTLTSAAEAIGISKQAVEKWPDPLPPRIADRVYAVLARKHLPAELLPATDHAQAAEAPRFIRDDGTESPDTRNPEDLGRVWVAVPRRRSTDKPNAANERGGC
jgi:hypothetical protein